MTTTSSASLSARIVTTKQAAGLLSVLFHDEAEAEWFLEHGEIAVTLISQNGNKTLQPYRRARECVCNIMAGPGRMQMFELTALDANGHKKISLRVADEIVEITA